MIEDLSVLGVITARGGSKGLPGKNILPLAGQPLIAWTIGAAKESAHIDRLILSSDSREIIDAAAKWGCDAPFIRPDELAQDDTPSSDVLQHALDNLDEEYDLLVVLQPTSPLRNAQDIDGCIKRCVETRATSCVSISETKKSPYLAMELDENQTLRPILPKELLKTRRQDLPATYTLNGAVYTCRVNAFRESASLINDDTVGFIMPASRSIDIDDKLDLEIAELLVKSS